MNDYWEEEEEFEESVDQTQPRRIARRRRRANEARGNLYLLTGLILGIGLGLLIAWVISPVQYLETDPRSLSPAQKDEYRRMVALAYDANRNLERARERARLVDGSNAIQQLAAQAQRMLSENLPPQDARAVAVLAADLARPEDKALAPSLEAGRDDPGSANIEAVVATETAAALASTQAAAQSGQVSQAVQTPTRPIPTNTSTPTRTPMPTFTPRPSATPMGALEAPFVMKERSEICDGSVPVGLLQVQVTDSEGEPLPGARVTVSYQNSEENFYTGLIPENGRGYADYMMKPGITYRVQVGSAGEQVDFEVPDCGGGWVVEFTNSP